MNDRTMTTAEAIEAITAARDLERQGIPTTATQEVLVEILKPKGAPCLKKKMPGA